MRIGNVEYDLVLQFHPLHLVDAFLIYTIVLTLPDKAMVPRFHRWYHVCDTAHSVFVPAERV